MLHTKLRRFQQKGVDKIQDFEGRALLCYEQGLGKTVTSLAWYDEFISHLPGLVIICCPSTLRWQWQDEIKKFLHIDSTVIDGRTPPFQDEVLPDGIYIISYDSVGHDPNANNWLRLLSYQHIKLVICDEAQYVQHNTAKRTKGVKQLAALSSFRLMLSGTPFTNYPAGLYPLLEILGLKKYFPSERKFLHRYCDPQLRHWGWEYKGATNVEELRRILLRTCLIRELKENVLKELPPKNRMVRVLRLNDKNMKEYNQVKNNFIGWIGDTRPEKLTAALKAERLIHYGYMKRTAGKLKVKTSLDWIQTLLDSTNDDKIIVFAVQVEVVLAIYNRFKGQAVYVNGSVIGKERQKRIDQFRNSKDVRIFVGNIQAAGTGWNGQCAKHVVFVEMGYTPAEHAQAEDRTHRIGQLGSVNIYYLVCRDTIEEPLCELLQEKQVAAAAILDGKKKADFDLYDQLQLRLQGKK